MHIGRRTVVSIMQRWQTKKRSSSSLDWSRVQAHVRNTRISTEESLRLIGHLRTSFEKNKKKTWAIYTSTILAGERNSIFHARTLACKINECPLSDTTALKCIGIALGMDGPALALSIYKRPFVAAPTANAVYSFCSRDLIWSPVRDRDWFVLNCSI